MSAHGPHQLLFAVELVSDFKEGQSDRNAEENQRPDKEASSAAISEQTEDTYLKMISSTLVRVAPMLFSTRFRDCVMGFFRAESPSLEPRDRLRWSWKVKQDQ